MRIAYAIALLLLSSSTLLAQTGFSIQPGFVVKQSPLPPQAPPVGWSPVCRCDEGLRCICGAVCPCKAPMQAAPKQDHGWTDLGNGVQQHSSGYLYHPAQGVYWPTPVVQPMPFYSRSIPFYSGGFAGNCPPSG